MFRDGKFKKHEHINVQFDNGGLGDCIAQMPAIKYIRDYAPNVTLHCWTHDYFVDFAKKLCPGVIIHGLSEAKKKFNPKLASVRMSHPQHTNLGSHMVDVGFHLLADKQVPIEHKNYLSLPTNNIKIDKFKLPDKYIVLSVGFTVPVREMLPSVANGIIDYCKGQNIPVVVLGNQITLASSGYTIVGQFKEEINYQDTINLINKTNLLESAAIIARSNGIVGLDNGLLHVAGCTEAPIVAAYTTVRPEHRLPIRHNELGWNCYSIEPPVSLACRGCQSNMIHVYDHDFRKCYYDEVIPSCVKLITADKYIEHIKKLI